MTTVSLRLGEVQAGAVEVYVIDPAHEIDLEHAAFQLRGHVLNVDLSCISHENAVSYLNDAAESAYASKDTQYSNALSTISYRLATMKVTRG